MSKLPTFTCPRCGRTSANPNDVRERYCGHCHDWTGVTRSVVVMRLEKRTPTVLPVLMVNCDRCDRPCWIEGGNDDTELIQMQHLCQECMQDLIDEDPSIQQAYEGHYEPATRRMPINPHYADQATTAAAALLKAYNSKDNN